MLKNLFFDLDNTLTRTKSAILPNHADVLKQIIACYNSVIVSGCDNDEIMHRIPRSAVGAYGILGQNGNTAQTADGKNLWQRYFSTAQKNAVLQFITRARIALPLQVVDENDLIADRGSQISYSLIGHNEDKDKKERFDPDHKIRQDLLRTLSDEIDTLAKIYSIEILIAGTTTLDIIPLGKNKGYNVSEFINITQWNADECLYIGDSLFAGGNDETVIGIIPTMTVKNFDETYEYLNTLVG